MLTRSVIGLAVSGLALTHAPAYAALADADLGPTCSFATVIDPTAEEGTQSGQLEGGPTQFTEQPDGTTADQGTLVCRVQVVDAFTSDHNGTGPFVSGHTNAAGVAVAGPQLITIQRTGTQNVFLCSEFVDDASGTTYYWDDDLSEWSTSSLVHCGLSVTGDDGSGPEDDPLNRVACPSFAELPSPLAETLQEAWQDCAGSGPRGTIDVEGYGPIGLLSTPQGWSCDRPSGPVLSSGSVTCSPPGLNSLTKCKQVRASAAMQRGARGTVTTTTECPPLTVTATASGGRPYEERRSWEGFGSMPVTCRWGSSAESGWTSICWWNFR